MSALARKRKSGPGQSSKGRSADSLETGTTKRQKLPVRSKDGIDLPALDTASKSNLIKFDDDETSSALQVAQQTVFVSDNKSANALEQASDQEDSDDDAAPEAVSTAQAASDAKKSSRATQDAVRSQAAAEKRKRQERDTFLKKQAAERKRADKERGQVDAHIDSQYTSIRAVTQARLDASEGRLRRDKAQLPEVLPADLLTDSSSEDEQDETAKSRRPKKKTMAALERTMSRQERGPRDQVIGSTVYRVVSKQEQRLAPKMNKHSRNFKDELRVRGRAMQKPRGGLAFFTNK
ncbi:hypothetical protein CDD81_5172 [Ophiocordyceps australis]|uniref:Uncharacterized protein n=1 Tax=Ophiocordyceps australis TaxID=1399860 RepID=A0A2C5Y8K2_9HYPO|nr:hypothetical protein CDD81_5172 [Ophiocordyceps australis]